MKVTDVSAFVTKPPGAFSNYVFVKVSTDEGLVGWGESSIGAISVAAVVEEFGAAIVGRDPFRIEEAWQHMYHLHHNIRGGALQMAAISGIEIALWDIKGKALGVPVYEFLGGAMRDKLWTYGRFDGVDPDAAVSNTMAAIHVDACTPNFLIQEGGHAEWYDSILTEPFQRQVDGYFDLPTGPGLGIEVSEDGLNNNPVNSVDAPGGYRSRYTLPSRQQNHWV